LLSIGLLLFLNRKTEKPAAAAAGAAAAAAAFIVVVVVCSVMLELELIQGHMAQSHCCGLKWVRVRCVAGQSVVGWCGGARVHLCVCYLFSLFGLSGAAMLKALVLPKSLQRCLIKNKVMGIVSEFSTYHTQLSGRLHTHPAPGR
jgi:hypothetical protein